MNRSSCLGRCLKLGVAVILALSLAGPLRADSPEETPGVPSMTLPETAQGSPPSWAGKAFRQGVVAVSHPLAAEAGAAALENGGNAFDAVAAIQFALNVVEPQFSGIGGGGFMVIHLAETKENFMLDCREKAPAAATANQFQSPGSSSQTNGLAVGVPGTLKCLSTAVTNWGTRSLTEALQPAIKLAEEGFQINRFLAADIQSSRTNLQPETRAVFRPGGVTLKEGDLLVQPDLAKTFRLIAEQGPDVFYLGEIAPKIIEAQQRYSGNVANRGRMTLADLAAYNVLRRNLITVNYRGYTLASSSPPSSGGLTVGQMLKMLERFPLGDASQGYGFGATTTLHVMIEAMRLAFADRAIYMGDEDFVPVPKVGLLADPYVAMRADKISPTSRMATPSAGDPWPFEPSAGLRKPMLLAAAYAQPDAGHTTHFSVVDKLGNVVSYTTTIEAGWGTGIMVPGYGFLLNNELTDFNINPTYNPSTGNPGANDVAAFKRPRSSMSPSILFKDGTPIAAYGSPGGATIINSALQITLNLVDHGMTIQEAIDAPRISVTSATGSVSREAGFSSQTITGLTSLGHPVSGPSSIGSVQAVVIDLQTGKQYGGADRRREGTVIGLPRPQSD
jgi:gamma-glutamyltranspeptidase / glutathione hydrolase